MGLLSHDFPARLVRAIFLPIDTRHPPAYLEFAAAHRWSGLEPRKHKGAETSARWFFFACLGNRAGPPLGGPLPLWR